jgi:aldose 1-epimerase
VSCPIQHPSAQVWAPAADDVIAFEPMTAPTNALVDAGRDLPVGAGESYSATFAITLTGGA